VRKIRAGQVGSNSAVFAAEKALVGFENIRERLSIVLDAFRLSESHVLPATDDVGAIVYPM
jgi:hypothetical protein